MMKRLQGKTLMVLAGVTALHTPLGLQPVWAEAEPSDAVHLNEIEPSATTVDEWATQLAQAELIEITNIQFTATPQVSPCSLKPAVSWRFLNPQPQAMPRLPIFPTPP